MMKETVASVNAVPDPVPDQDTDSPKNNEQQYSLEEETSTGLVTTQHLSSNSALKISDVKGSTRKKLVKVVDENETQPMNSFYRKGQELKHLVRSSHKHSSQDIKHSLKDIKEEKGETEKPSPQHVQYRIKARRKLQPTNALDRFLMNYGCNRHAAERDFENMTDARPRFCFFCNPSKMLYHYLFWTFRTSFLMLFLSSLFFFFALILITAGLMMIVGANIPECFSPEYSAELGFGLAFALSWTTFSTVGYGHTYPSLDDSTMCGALSFLASMESFVGVLYAGFCGAILFGKVLRIQSRAQVHFSDPIVIRYGTGVERDDDLEDPSTYEKIPCPVLEFRVANKLFDQSGGEIMDATLNCVAMLNVKAATRTRSRLSKKRRSLVSLDLKSILNNTNTSEIDTATKPKAVQASYLTNTPEIDTATKPQAVRDQTYDEDPTSKLAPKLIFSKLLIDSPELPYFKRVWTARHIIDASSPLLTPQVRKQVKRNNGYWPAELNTYNGVRESIEFRQIVASLAGVSNVSASSVYGQKIYDFVDINVGYQFSGILYRDDNDNVMVDLGLINDVMEQNGGGGEPLVDFN